MNAIYLICKSGPEWCIPVAWACFKSDAEQEARKLDAALSKMDTPATPAQIIDSLSRHEVIRLERHVGRRA